MFFNVDILVIIVIVLIIGLVSAYLIYVKRRGGCAGCPYGSKCKGGCDGSCGGSIKAADGSYHVADGDDTSEEKTNPDSIESRIGETDRECTDKDASAAKSDDC